MADDIRIVYKRKTDLKREIQRQIKERELAQRKKEDLETELKILEEKKKEIDARLVQARVSLEQLDSTRMIAEESRNLEQLETEKKNLLELCRKLESFQTAVSELMNQFFRGEKDG